MTSPTVYIYYDPPYCRCAGLPQGGWLLPAEKGLPAAGDPGEGSEAGQDQHLLHLALTHTQGSKGTGLAGGQSCRNPGMLESGIPASSVLSRQFSFIY